MVLFLYTNSHHTPQAILLGLEGFFLFLLTPSYELTYIPGSDPETVDTGTIPSRYADILQNKNLLLGGSHRITYDIDRDTLWRWDQVLKTHPNGMRFSCFGEDGDLLATNEYFSVGGGFVVNDKTKGYFFFSFLIPQTGIECYSYLVDENLFYKGVDKTKVHGARLHQSLLASEPVDEQMSSVEGIPSRDNVETATETQYPPYPFDSGNSLLALTRKHNVGSTVPSDNFLFNTFRR